MPNKTKQNHKNSTEQICSQPLYKSQTTHHTQPTPTTSSRRLAAQATTTLKAADAHTVLNVNPTVCLSATKLLCPTPKNAPTPTTHHGQRTNAGTRRTTHHTSHMGRRSKRIAPHTTGLPRKEVIQPHLPVRLPCYDFVPIANPTFDHSPRTKRLGHGLRVLPTFVT